MGNPRIGRKDLALDIWAQTSGPRPPRPWQQVLRPKPRKGAKATTASPTEDPDPGVLLFRCRGCLRAVRARRARLGDRAGWFTLAAGKLCGTCSTVTNWGDLADDWEDRFREHPHTVQVEPPSPLWNRLEHMATRPGSSYRRMCRALRHAELLVSLAATQAQALARVQRGACCTTNHAAVGDL